MFVPDVFDSEGGHCARTAEEIAHRVAIMEMQIEQRAALPAPGTPIQFAEFIKNEIDTWGAVVRATGTKPGT